MNRPTVTIGIAAFNAESTLERAVRSAQAQTLPPLDIVIVDDCSSDETPALLTGLAARDPKIRIFRNARNGGVAVTRNRILAEARGEFVAFFDDDDESAPERIEAQLDRVLTYEREFAGGAPVICHSARRQVYPDSIERVAPTMGTRRGRAAPSGEAVAARILLGTALEDGYGACPTCSQMARLSTYRVLGGFDPAFRRSEDTDLNVRLAISGGHFAGIEQPMVTQFLTKTSDKSLADEYRYAVMMLDKHRDFVNWHGNFAFVRRWLEVKQCWLESRQGAFVWRLGMLALRYPRESLRRLALAMPNMALNRAFSRFHLKS